MLVERIEIKLNSTKIKENITQIEGSNRCGGKIELVYYNDKPCFNVYISKTNKINMKTEHKLQNEQNKQYIYIDCIQNELAEKIFKLFNNKEITKYYLTINTNNNGNDAECIIAFHKDDKINNDKNTKKQKRTIIGVSILLIIVISIFIFVVSNTRNIATNNTITTNNIIKNSAVRNTKTEKKENPYKITNDYNGTYKFVINEESKTTVGAINIDGGNLKVKFSNIGSNSIAQTYNGFGGLNKEDNSIFYISIMNSSYERIREFKCSKSDKNLIGESMTGTSYKKIDFIYVNDGKDIETVYNETLKQEKEKKEAEEKIKKEKEEQDFKASCKTYTFEQMARNPDNFKGTNVKLTGEVVQALYVSNSVNLRVNITRKGSYSTYYTDTIYVTYYTKHGEDKILEDDIITIWGTSEGDCSYTSVMGATVTLPKITAKYLQIDSK